MTVTLKSMRYFTCAVKHESIARAAEELNIAASAISMAIDQVEAHFELKLVHRYRSRGIKPSASGKVMALKFTALLDEYDVLLLEGAELKQSLSGSLRIGYYAPVAPAFLPSILTGLLPAEGGVTLEFSECDNDVAQSGLLNGDYDVILFVSNSAHPQVEFDKLIDAPPYCLLPEAHPLVSQKSIRISDLADSSLIYQNRPLAFEYYQELLASTEHKHRIIAYANSTEMVRSLVGTGLGCAILNMIPETAISYAGDRLVSLPIVDPIPPLTLSIGYDKINPRRLVQRFVEDCRSYFDDNSKTRCIVR